MIKIKFGTDVWRAIIADDFTVENVKRVAYATALWLKKEFKNASAVVGSDPRFAGPMFADITTRVLASQGRKSFSAEKFFCLPPHDLAGYGKETCFGRNYHYGQPQSPGL